MLPDFFTPNAFNMISLTARVNKLPFTPGRLGQQRIFREHGVPTTTIAIEERDNTLSLIQTSERGAPRGQHVRDKRKIRNLTIPHLAKDAIVKADEVQGVRAFGSETGTEAAEQVLDDKIAQINLDHDLTLENLRFGAIKGIILDADGTQIYNLFTEFGVAQIAEFDFALGTPTTEVREKCMQLRRLMAVEIGMGNMPFRIGSMCSDEFFDDLLKHASTKTAVERWRDGQALRDDLTYATFHFAGIDFENYRGTDDGTTLTVAANKANFYPVGVPGIFENPFAPGDTVSTVNTIGLPRYGFPLRDPQPDPKWIGTEVQSNPLPFCTRPRVLIQGKRA